MGKERYKMGLFAALMMVLLLPAIQQLLQLHTSAPLAGDVRMAGRPSFSLQAWWDGNYQAAQNEYLNDNMGFRPELVRMNNELDMRLFRKVHARGVVIGRNGCLYEQGYIDEYTGLEYIQDSLLRKELIMLRMVQDTLERMGKTFVFVEAASKAYYYPELFPDNVRNRRAREVTTLTKHTHLCDSLGIHHINMNAWFTAMRHQTDKEPLFSYTGTHWSVYGALKAADSLSVYLSSVRHISIPAPRITSLHYTDTPRFTDDDIARGLNVFTPLHHQQLCYPQYDYPGDTSSRRPHIIFVGDSFLWTWVNNGYMQAVSDSPQFWYYFNEVWKPGQDAGPVRMADYNWQQALMHTDCLVALYGTINLKSLIIGDSFIAQMYAWFYPGRPL